ncbi:hypothetical protein AGR1B_Lc50461 [Agrobacterium fabacearum S56]|nr:hypothetical protein AGR1B_Lc50461 [Agrobacterium fabacearum S56]
MRNSNVVSMEKFPFFIHGTSITDQATAHNVGAEHRLRMLPLSIKIIQKFHKNSYMLLEPI